jgi:hypothetical protein
MRNCNMLTRYRYQYEAADLDSIISFAAHLSSVHSVVLSEQVAPYDVARCDERHAKDRVESKQCQQR